MKKIAKIIEHCQECCHVQKFYPAGDNDSDCIASVCIKTKHLISLSRKPLMGIPDWCPLENYVDHSARATETPATVLLPSMPHLEWAPENLTGHGGTEVDGRWYYTWEQAMAAAKELGDCWRLPTAEEFEQLCNAGSTWVGNGPDGQPGCWFGGNHDTDHEGSIFFPAAGFRLRDSGALSSVGRWGGSWSSSPAAWSSAYALHLDFGASYVYPLGSHRRAYGLPVRCVRSVV